MIRLKFDADCAPRYMTEFSAACDLIARECCILDSNSVLCVPTGVWIESVDWSLVPPNFLPELQIRARSGLARKHGVMLANGVGTIDADYPDEIGVLLLNVSKNPFEIKKGDRIAQMALNLVARIPGVIYGGARVGGFGSTSV